MQGTCTYTMSCYHGDAVEKRAKLWVRCGVVGVVGGVHCVVEVVSVSEAEMILDECITMIGSVKV